MTPSTYTRPDGSTVVAHPFGIGSTAQMGLADWCDTRGQELRLIDGALIFYSRPLASGNTMGWKFGMLHEPGSRYRSTTVHIGDYIVDIPGHQLVVMGPDRFLSYLGIGRP